MFSTCSFEIQEKNNNFFCCFGDFFCFMNDVRKFYWIDHLNIYVLAYLVSFSPQVSLFNNIKAICFQTSRIKLEGVILRNAEYSY